MPRPLRNLRRRAPLLGLRDSNDLDLYISNLTNSYTSNIEHIVNYAMDTLIVVYEDETPINISFAKFYI